MSGSERCPTDEPIKERKVWVCDRCGKEPTGDGKVNGLQTYTCGCDVTVFPTAPEPNIPASWKRVSL